MSGKASTRRKQAVSTMKRSLILDAATKVFAAEGLSGASLRAIAAEAGYTPAALYFHFDSKEAIYGALLHSSLLRLRGEIEKAVSACESHAVQITGGALAFFDYYACNPRDLDLGFYLFRDGMTPQGLGRERDAELNTALESALQPIANAARGLGVTEEIAREIMVDIFAHATGLLLLAHTRRIRMFETSAREMMQTHVARLVTGLAEKD